MKFFKLFCFFQSEIQFFQLRWIVAMGIFMIGFKSIAQQCTLPSRIFLPTADEAQFELVGRAIDVHNNYMVVGASENSSQQVYSGRVIVYKLGIDNQWVEVAELTPSDPSKNINFGDRVAIYGNSIAVAGREFNDEGISRDKLYFFEKTTGEDWTSSAEDYVIAKPFGAPLEEERFGEFDIHGDELVAVAYKGDRSFIEVYTKSAGVFSLSQSINTPPNSPSFASYQWYLAVGDDMIAIATEQYYHNDGSNNNGGVFIYARTAGGSYSTSPSLLRGADPQGPTDWFQFGVAIAISNSTVFVQGVNSTGSSYNQSFYIFEKPAGGWIDAAQPLLLQAPGYIQLNARLVANDNYIFSAGPDHKSIISFKKPAGGWSAAASRFELNDNHISGTSQIGWSLALNGNHLVAGCPARFLFTGVGEELILSYYAPASTWETLDVTIQEIDRTNDFNATDDFFGAAFSVYNNQLAISATGDDERAVDAGTVYIFNTLSQQVEPDQKIFNPEDENYTGFGNSIAVGDSVMFIGAPYKDSLNVNGTIALFDIGKVYVYRQTINGWVYASQIKAPVINAHMAFGQRVVWSKGYCAVTQFRFGDSEQVGHVHIYKENPTTKKFEYLATLDPAVHQRSDFFGNSMVMNDSLMVIGTGYSAPDVRYRQSAYVFRKKGEWKNATEDARLYPSNQEWYDRFGASVSMYGKYIVVGAPYSPGWPENPKPGAAYIFKQPPSGWKGELTEIAKLSPSDPIDFGTFGTTVVIDHNDIFIGSPNKYLQYNVTDNFTNNDNQLIPGKVYHYKKQVGMEWQTTNQETRQIRSFEPDIIDGYGATMFVSDRYLYVGAMLDDTESGFRSGSVQTMMQLPVIDDPPVVCQSEPSIKLFGFPKNGNWSGPGVHPTTGMFNPTVAGPGIHTITYERSGCETTTQVEVIANEFNIVNQSEPLQIKCIESEVSIVFETNLDPASYTWYFKETLNEQYVKFDSLKASIVASRPGYYQASIAQEICPTIFSEPFRIIDDEPISIQIDPVPTICDDNNRQFVAKPASGQWSGTAISAEGTFDPHGLEDGVYKSLYNIITPVGCQWKDSVMVRIDKLKQPTLQYNGDQICGDQPVELTVLNTDNRSTIVWYGPDGNVIPGQINFMLVGIIEPGLYRAEVSKSICNLSTLPVEVSAVEDSLFIPNVFTPNGDDINDFFEVRSNGISDFHILVINRDGRSVFESNDIHFQWPASGVSSGVYFWSILYTTCWNERKTAKGWVHIIY